VPSLAQIVVEPVLILFELVFVAGRIADQIGSAAEQIAGQVDAPRAQKGFLWFVAVDPMLFELDRKAHVNGCTLFLPNKLILIYQYFCFLYCEHSHNLY
jgi:hypothetical protein